jgi:hypothetical protein
MEKSNRKFKLIVSVIILLVSFCFSVFLSHYTYNTDFGVYYYAASTILDPNTPNISVYDIDTANKYSIPEAIENAGFPYSMPAAYIMAPLALIPYFKAKAAMIFINILMYLSAIIIALKMGRASGRWFAYPLALLCLWWPFIQNMRQGQVNGILLFLIALAVLAVVLIIAIINTFTEMTGYVHPDDKMMSNMLVYMMSIATLLTYGLLEGVDAILQGYLFDMGTMIVIAYIFLFVFVFFGGRISEGAETGQTKEMTSRFMIVSLLLGVIMAGVYLATSVIKDTLSYGWAAATLFSLAVLLVFCIVIFLGRRYEPVGE